MVLEAVKRVRYDDRGVYTQQEMRRGIMRMGQRPHLESGDDDVPVDYALPTEISDNSMQLINVHTFT